MHVVEEASPSVRECFILRLCSCPTFCSESCSTRGCASRACGATTPVLFSRSSHILKISTSLATRLLCARRVQRDALFQLPMGIYTLIIACVPANLGVQYLWFSMILKGIIKLLFGGKKDKKGT